MKAYILLDRSGSMASRWAETIGAIGIYADGLKAIDDATLTLAVFDSSEKTEYRQVIEAKPAKDWTGIPADINPRGGTPLFDAVSRIVSQIKTDDPAKATLVIVTDGQENSSKEITKEQAKALLDELRAKGYDVVFIGADFNNFSQASGLGNAAGSTIAMNAGSYDNAMRSMSARTMSYSAGADAKGLNFSDEDRKRAAGSK